MYQLVWHAGVRSPCSCTHAEGNMLLGPRWAGRPPSKVSKVGPHAQTLGSVQLTASSRQYCMCQLRMIKRQVRADTACPDPRGAGPPSDTPWHPILSGGTGRQEVFKGAQVKHYCCKQATW